eukprot:Gb_20197 [translate_table: standard]
MAPLLWNQNKVLLFLGSMLQFSGRKTITTGFKREENCNLIRMLSKQGRLKEALQILHVMEQRVDSTIYDCFLQGCVSNKALPETKLVHNHMVQTGFKCPDISLGNKLVTVYARCGNMVDARRVFDQMAERDVVSWTAMIAAHARHGQDEVALMLFSSMQRTEIQPNQFTFASVLPACANLAYLERGKEIHEEIIRLGYQSDVFVGNALVDMYAKCGSIENARHVFDTMAQRDVVSWNAMVAGYAQNGHVDKALKLFQEMPERVVISWNAMIAGYAQNGLCEEALKLFQLMQRVGVKPNSKTFTSVLPACSNLAALEQGREIHEEIIRHGFQCDIFLGSALIDMYAKCGNIENAHNLFHKIPQRDMVSWTAMIAGYAQNGYVDEALELFQKMPKRDLISWNVMIAGYTQNGHDEEAMKLFQQMQLEGVKPNAKTFASVIPACANLAALQQGTEIHEEIISSGFQSDVFVTSALVDMYAKCGKIENARDLFDKMNQRNLVSWTAVIAGYAQNGNSEEALNLFRQMHLADVTPNSKTFASVLSACANLAALEEGKEIHDEIVRSGFQSDVFVGNALVDMYSKCGSIENARNVFDKIQQTNVVSWNAMISGYAMHGRGTEALKLFEQMQHSTTNPDHITLVSVLSACCHAGLVDKGWQYFNCMSEYYHIKPTMEHYGCMVDLLVRAGYLDEAVDFIDKMPIKPDATVWVSLLGACRIHCNIELGECVAEHLFKLDPKNAAPYVLLSNMYAAAGRWNDIERVRKMMKERRVKKKPGCSWIEVNKRMYAFLSGDRSHPQTQEIYEKLERLSREMKSVGYMPDTRFVQND